MSEPTAPIVESRWSKWKAPLALLVALIVVDALVWHFRDTWQLHSPDDYQERLEGCRQRQRDFVFVGGSPVSEGLDPSVIEGIVWNGELLADGYSLGLPGATTSESYHAFLHGCEKPPKLLIYGITASDLNDGRQEPHGPYSLMTWYDWFVWVSRKPKSTEWVTRHFLQSRLARSWSLFRFRHGIRMWAAVEADRWFPGCCPESLAEAEQQRSYAEALRNGQGYAPAPFFVVKRWDLVKAESQGQLPPFPFLIKYRTGEHLGYLHRMLALAKSRGTDVLLVDMPLTADLEGMYPEPIAEYRQLLTELEESRGLTVIRADRELVGLTDADFADLIHLNGNGANKLSHWLRERLVEIEASR